MAYLINWLKSIKQENYKNKQKKINNDKTKIKTKLKVGKKH